MGRRKPTQGPGFGSSGSRGMASQRGLTHAPHETAAVTATEDVAAPLDTTEDSGGDVHIALGSAAPTLKQPSVSYIVVDEELNEQLHSESPRQATMSVTHSSKCFFFHTYCVVHFI